MDQKLNSVETEVEESLQLQAQKIAQAQEETENITKPLLKADVKLKKKKEIQGTIIQKPAENDKATEEDFFSVLKTIAPGTNFRIALDNALKMGKGALIVVENEQVNSILDGGFRVNCRFTPQRLAELTKMDGAIILSKDLKRILHANVLLTPSAKIKTHETGTRHKAAERSSRQTGSLVIAISERKNEITLFYKNVRYPLKSTEEILRKANEHVQLLEKQREIFDRHIERLNALELRNYPSITKAIQVIQKGKIIEKIAFDLKKHIIELGNESMILKTRLKELVADVEKETSLVIKDYTKLDIQKSRMLLDTLSYDEILDSSNILSALAYEKQAQHPQIKGWRILSKTSLLEQEIAAVIRHLGTLGRALHSNPSAYSEVIGGDKATLFKEEIDKIKLNY